MIVLCAVSVDIFRRLDSSLGFGILRTKFRNILLHRTDAWENRIEHVRMEMVTGSVDRETKLGRGGCSSKTQQQLFGMMLYLHKEVQSKIATSKSSAPAQHLIDGWWGENIAASSYFPKSKILLLNIIETASYPTIHKLTESLTNRMSTSFRRKYSAWVCTTRTNVVQ